MKATSITRNLFGLAVAGVGVGFLLDALNVIDFSSVAADWWPLAVIAVGLLSLINNPREKLWPFFIIGAGVLLQLRELDALEFNVWSIIWPSLLIVIGLSFIFERVNPMAKVSSDSTLNLFTVFSGLETQNKSNNFAGGKITAVFGGSAVDLREATLKDEATIDVFAAFGGAEIRVPENWKVHVSGLPIFGGWEDKTQTPNAKKAPVLHIRGTCIFGGVEIKN